MKKDKPRRAFFKTVLGGTAAATTVLAVSGCQSKQDAKAETSAKSEQKGYQESQHVKDYYRTIS